MIKFIDRYRNVPSNVTYAKKFNSLKTYYYNLYGYRAFYTDAILQVSLNFHSWIFSRFTDL